MIALLHLLRNFFRREALLDPLIEVRRMPSTKALRAHLAGLSAGFLLVALNLFFPLPSAQLLARALLLLWFALATYYSGVFFAANFIIFLLLVALSPGGFLALFLNSCQWYFLGYFCGAIMAILYNDLVHLFITRVESDKIKTAFVYHRNKKVNIIKSPIAGEEQAFNALLAQKPEAAEQRLYKYKLTTPPERPYTIAFIANPKIHKRGGDENLNSGYIKDPIIEDLQLFLRAVDRALFCFERDPVIGRPEIWSRVRVVTIFNPTAAEAGGPEVGLLEEFQRELANPDGSPIENNLIDAMQRMFANFNAIFDASNYDGPPSFERSQIDVLYGLTASLTHDRSTAHYSDWIEHEERDGLHNVPGRKGTPFTFEIDPAGNKEQDKNGNVAAPPNTVYPQLYPEPIPDPNYDFRTLHDFCATRPGRVALNVLGARHKTYIHEFGHAMSSCFHGTITDEYIDYFLIDPDPADNPPNQLPEQTPHFFVNRIDRNIATMHSAEPIPVPKIFAEYNATRYAADLAHPSAEETWTGYFPDKFGQIMPCTMDRTGAHYHFDELLSAFIYDRLMAKIRRQHTDCTPSP